MEQVKVLSAATSPFTMRVLVALEEKGVKYEYQEEGVPFTKSDLLLQMNPVYKKVPVVIHNGQPICKSLIILQYIDDTWGSKKILPYDHTLARFWAEFLDKKEQAKRDMLENVQFLEDALKEMSARGSLPFFGGKDFGFLDIALTPYVSWFHTFESIGNFKLPFETDYLLLVAWVKRCTGRESVKKNLPSSQLVFERALEIRKSHMVD